MSTAPPDFDSISVTTAEIHALLKEAIDKVDKSTVTSSLHSILDSDVNKKLIEENINRLAKKTLDTRSAFEEISQLLHSFDREKFKTTDDTKICPLGPGWDDLRKRYDVILKKSRSDAVVIKGVCDDYIQTVLGIVKEPDVDLKDVKNEIDDFIRRTAKARKEAESDSSSFDLLRQDVNSYKKKIYDIFATADADPEGLQLDVELLKQKISRLQNIIAETTTAALGGDTAAIETAGGAVGVLFAFCPILAGLLIGGILGATGAADVRCRFEAVLSQRQMEKAQCDLEKKEKELVQLRARVSKLDGLKAQLNEMETPFKDIVKQLGALSNFWQSVDAQCQEALINLNKGKDAETPFSTKKFLGDNLTGSSYRALSRALATYVSQITQLE